VSLSTDGSTSLKNRIELRGLTGSALSYLHRSEFLDSQEKWIGINSKGIIRGRVEAFFFVLFLSLSLGIEGRIRVSLPFPHGRFINQPTGFCEKNKIELRVLHHIDIPPPFSMKYEWRMEARSHALSRANIFFEFFPILLSLSN
jgi:hypothetical protein